MSARRHPVVEEDLRAIAAHPLAWDRFGGRTVLVTGASGLVASYLVETLLHLNETLRLDVRVVALVRDEQRARERFAVYDGRPDLRYLVQSAADPLALAGRADYIVHAAGHASPRWFGLDPVGTYAPNVLGTHHLLTHAHDHGTESLLFVSSGAVHGALPAGAVLTENTYGVVDPLDVKSCYAESKRMGETMCASWFVQFGVPARIARLGHTYGPGMRRDDERAFADFVFSVVDGRDIVLNSDGLATRMFCYLSDATVGLLAALLAGRPGEAYLVANGEAATTIRALAELVTSLYPERGSRVRVEPAARPTGYLPNTDPAMPLDTSKMRALGWQPAVGLTEGFRRTIASYL